MPVSTPPDDLARAPCAALKVGSTGAPLRKTRSGWDNDASVQQPAGADGRGRYAAGDLRICGPCRDLVSRVQAQDDLRRTLVSITAEGHRLFDEIAPLQEARYDLITQRFGYGKLELLYELLDELIEKVGEEEDKKD